jgi:hypothetical protein
MVNIEPLGWNLVQRVTLQASYGISDKAYFWESKIDPLREVVRFDLAELHDWGLAQRHLFEVLNYCMRPDIPHGTGDLAHLGDVNFVSREAQSDIPAAIWFTRGNVCVSVSSPGKKIIDVTAVAVFIDSVLQNPHQKLGRVWKSTPRTATLKAGEAHVLIGNLLEAAPHGEWLMVIAPDGELSRKDDALIYVSEGNGVKQIGIFSASSS